MSRKFIVDEEELFLLLIAKMECAMLNRDGVNNWAWYGESQEEVAEEFHPEHLSNVSFDECAAAILDSDQYILFSED